MSQAKPSLTVNLMTRGRPKVAFETIELMLPLIKRKNTTFMLLVDDDDAPSIAALKQFTKHPNVLLSVKPRENTRGEKYDRALKEAPADIYLPMCDYAPIITEGFDELVVQAAARFPDGIGCVYSELANMSFPHYQAPTAKLVAKMGYIYPPWFPFWFIDHWLDDLSRMIDRISYAEIKCDVSRQTGKTIGLRDLMFWTTLYDAGKFHRRELALSIINGKDFQDPDWRKDILRSHFPLIEHRSVCINHSVRVNIPQIEADRGGVESQPDERYQRIKAKADRLMHQWAGTFLKDRQNAIVAEIAEAAWNRDKDKVTSLMHEWKACA